MNFLGMGSFEIVVVLLVAFIVLGPKRMTEAARMLGKATREIRRMTESLPEMLLDEEDQSQVPEWRRTVAGPSSRRRVQDDIGAPEDGAVAFTSGAEPKLPAGPDVRKGVEGPDGAALSEGDEVTDGPVASKSGAEPGPTGPSRDENGVVEPESSPAPEREAK